MSVLAPLHDTQRQAAEPGGNAWVSASAGAGKTQVLTARVLRLLLAGARPEGILCLTYTKAAAAEMQNRIFTQLGRWVRADDAAVGADLAALGCEATDGQIAAARRLFARALEARGGLRVQTLHSFAQSVLAGFPVEAQVPPGFEILDERTSQQLGREVMADVLTRAQATGDREFLDDIGQLSVGLGEMKLASMLRTLVREHAALGGLGPPAGYEPMLRAWLGLPLDIDGPALLAASLSDEAFDCASLHRFTRLLIDHGSARSAEAGKCLERFLNGDPAARAECFDEAAAVFITRTEGKLSSKLVLKAMRLAEPDSDELAARLFEAFAACRERQARLELAKRAALHLRVGAVLADASQAAKARAGALDFDDVIAAASRLLQQQGLSDWVRYKLDQSVEHILVDEGQDTNAAQWAIIEALAAEFFSGESRSDAQRTMFAVGDFKQAIFGFQGSDPQLFLTARERYQELAQGAALPFADLKLARNFRSAPAVLTVVDKLLEQIGFAGLGLDEAVPPHEPARRDQPGMVALWPPVTTDALADATADEAGLGWMQSGEVLEARTLAGQIRDWVGSGLALPGRGRPVRAGDILVLVRNRSEFVGALVGALHEAGVAVAGVDRLKLTEPLAVQDLLALVRFVVQPDDDLTLAALLVSPFIGWGQEALLALAHGRRGTLWRALREAAGEVGLAAAEAAAEAAAWLGDVLGRADLSSPYRLLETVLSGPFGGRARLLGRLGGEARDAIDELLTQALLFEARQTPTLSGFLDWIAAEDVDVKRDPDTQPDAVRIMTVHGAKGLQAPVVILADAAKAGRPRAIEHVMAEVRPAAAAVPIFFGGKQGKLGPVETKAAEQEARERQEDLRLLYVALTRAEDMLFVAGALGQRDSRGGEAREDSWHRRVAEALTGLGAEHVADPVWAAWGDTLVFGHGPANQAFLGIDQHPAAPSVVTGAETAAAGRPGGDDPPAPRRAALPGWALTPPPPEAAPPRPLSPSRIGPDDLAVPPAIPGGGDAASRGRLLHMLFERLPALAPGKRHGAAARLLASRAPALSPAEREAIADAAFRVLDHPDYAPIFAPDALAEAPIAAVVGTSVIAGTVDRMLVEDDRILVVDFKTGRRVPRTPAEVPAYYLRQMGAYAAALARIFPRARIEAALLFTEGPSLVPLPAALLDEHAPAPGPAGEAGRATTKSVEPRAAAP